MLLSFFPIPRLLLLNYICAVFDFKRFFFLMGIFMVVKGSQTFDSFPFIVSVFHIMLIKAFLTP